MKKPLLHSCKVCQGTGELIICNAPKDPQDHKEWEITCEYCRGKGLIDAPLTDEAATQIRETIESQEADEMAEFWDFGGALR